MTEQQYVQATLRRVRATDAAKQRIRADLLADIAARRQAGQTWAQAEEELGSPVQAAAAINEAYAGSDMPRRYRRQQAARAAAIVLGVLAVLALLASPALYSLYLLLGAGGAGIIGGADGPTAIFVTAQPTALGGFLAVWGLPIVLGTLALASLVAWLVLRRHG